MAESRARHTWHYRPGEMVVAVELEGDPPPANLHARVRGALEQHLAGHLGGVFSANQRYPTPIVFRAPRQRPVAFLFYDLDPVDDPHAFVKQTVHAVQANDMGAF